MSHTPHDWKVISEPVDAWQAREGIDGHWKVTGGSDVFYVLHVAQGKGRWSGHAAYICSRCRDAWPSQYETGTVFCPHVEAVRERQRSPEPAA